MPDTTDLSDAARALLQSHRECLGRIAVDDANRELARAGLMIAVHTFSRARESRY